MKNQFFGVLLFICSWTVFSSETDTLQVYSPEMDKEIPILVTVPDNYNLLEVKYPVLYLLHGYSGNHLTWISRFPKLKKYVDEYQMIVVSVDGGYDSWYVDSPVDKKIRYESFITKTLVPTIDSLYHTIPDRDNRGIGGLSMGGHGALYLSIKHPDVFGAASSMSGGVDILPFPDNWGIKKVLGEQKSHLDNWKKHSVINLVDGLKADELKIFIDEGTDDIFIDQNRDLHQKLLDLKIPHDYIERPGAHTNDYWERVLPYHVLFFHEFFYQKAEN